MARTMASRVCQHPKCGRTFIVERRNVRPGRALYCSPECASSIKGLRCAALHPRQGANNPNWRGGWEKRKRAYVDGFRARYPEKAAAHDAVKKALQRGVLVKPSHCECCHEKPLEPLHSHHENYRKPLTVIWACRSCHRELDATRRARLAAEAAALVQAIESSVQAIAAADLRIAALIGHERTA